MRRRSSFYPPWVAFGWSVLFCALSGWGQVASVPAAPSQTVSPQQRPAGPLTQDSDPVPSPDPEKAPTSVVTAPGTPAQGGQVTREAGRYTLTANAFEVRLNASVIDGAGRNVETLARDAFHVYEDGVPQTILGFAHEDTPVSIGILIDSSGSMYDKRDAVNTAALNLVRLSNPDDEAFLVDFSSEPYIDQDFTNSVEKLQRALAYFKPSGGTALYDAVVASADYLSKNGKRPKQVILIVTDGEDNASSATLEQTIRRVQELDGPAIYCLGLLFGDDVSRREARHAHDVLQELADQTGGVAYFPRSLRDVDGIARQVAEDIRSQYTISYRSTKSPALGGYRQVHVEAKEKGFRGLQVRTRSGYYPKTGSGPADTSGEPKP